MTHTLKLGGVLVSSFTGQALLSLLILLALRPVLAWMGFQRWVWNPALAEFGLGICILGLVIFFL